PRLSITLPDHQYLLLPSHRHPRDLPSFPTRRSSDLDSGLLRAHVSAHVDRIGGPDVDTQFDVALHAYDAHPDDGGAELATARGTLHSDALVDSWECVRAGLLLPVGDRKSTRLNSSHVKISYAVFCLK